jgi:glutathione synthase/RimK-type ligase-like ATP-grasp enzyme
MNFYCITEEEFKERAVLLMLACEKLNVKYIELNPNNFCYSKIPKLKKTDFLYRISTSGKARNLERIILNKELTTFYSSFDNAFCKLDNVFGATLVFEKNQISIPKTVFGISKDKNALKKDIEYLGGFPIILKAVGLSMGIGVIKMDSFEALSSLSDYLCNNNENFFIMREFIDIGKPAYSYRAIVLGDKIDIIYKNQSVNLDDFRSNSDQLDRERKIITIDKKFQIIIIKALKVLGYELGAVDFVIKNGDLKIFEVNFPFNFCPVINDLKYPIADKMIEYLIKKSKLKTDRK